MDHRHFRNIVAINFLGLGGKTVEIDVEVIDRNLDYNILLGRPWIYAMAAVVSTYFMNIAFPFQGGITIVDQ